MPDFQFSFGELPEELKLKIQEEMDRHQMGSEAMHHDISRMFRELSKEHLAALRLVLHVCVLNPTAAAYYEGVASTHLTLSHGVCGCGEDHDGDAAELLNPIDENHPDVQAVAQQMRDQINSLDELEQYGVFINKHDDVECKGCGKIYPNLEDRMLRPPGPEGCPSCVDKQKWG